jgi:tetratricopeptide (TPR) repeat protein
VTKYFILGFITCIYIGAFGQSKKKASPIDSVSYYLSSQQFDKAIVLLDLQVSQNPKADQYVTRGLAKMELNNLEGALTDFQSSLRLMPKNDTAYYNIGYVHYLQGNYQLSVDYFDSALLYNHNNSFYLTARGGSFLEMENFNLAFKDYRQVIDLDEQADPGFYGMAMCHFFTDAYDSARYYLSYAIDIDPFDEDYYYQRALCKYVVEDVENALNDLDLALDIDPEFADAKLLRAQIYAENELFDEALSDLNEAYTSDSSNYEILRDRGNILLNLAEYQKAYLDFNAMLAWTIAMK